MKPDPRSDVPTSVTMKLSLPFTLFALALAPLGCQSPKSPPTDAQSTASVGTDPGGVGRGTPLGAKPGHALAAFAAGCFWGVEDAFRHVRGVTATAVGYTGGHTDDPNYETVCSHTTGHAETVLVEFDPKVVSYDRLVTVFFTIHDPTQLDRQGPDVGDQYRSEIFTFDDAQAKAAQSIREAEQKKSGQKLATKIEPVARFWKAEDYHQQYAERTGSHGCPIKLPDEST